MTSTQSSCIDHGRKGNRDGYTMQKVNGYSHLMHRVVYSKHNGVTLQGMKGKMVRHTCDNPRCINPEHLLLGTAQDNSSDMVSRNRQARGGSHGMSRFTPEDVKYIRENYKPFCKVNGAKALAAKYKVSPTAVRYVHEGRNWAHI